MTRAATLLLIAALVVPGGTPSARQLSVTDLLDRYAAGEFDAVAGILATMTDTSDLLRQLKADGPAWIAAKGSEELERRVLAAATFALEAARADEWNQWRQRVAQPVMKLPVGATYTPPDVLRWYPPPLLIEWGCQLFRRDPTPRPVERLWQLAALAVAERAEDADFLIGTDLAPLGKSEDEIYHLQHVLARFPNEPRLKLAYGIALDWRTWPQVPRKPGAAGGPRSLAAKTAFEALLVEEDIAAEASLRLGVLELRSGDLDLALMRFERVESSTREPYLIYLARYFMAQALEAKGREAEAMRSYDRALAAVPHAQSAALPFAAFLFKADRRAEAYETVAGALSRDPLSADPWRGYADADDRFWPLLLAQLHGLIRP